MTKTSPVNAKVIFTDGNIIIFAGNRFEKFDKSKMVYNLRKMMLKMLDKIYSIQMYDNELKEDKLIFEYKDAVVQRNFLVNYLGENFNPSI